MESDFSGSESPLSLIALVAGGFLLLFGGVAWSSGVPANRFVAFSMGSMVELIWVMADNTSASTLSVPWCEEFADSFSSESRFSSPADERGSLPLIFSPVMLGFSRCSLNIERERQQTSDLPEGSHTTDLPGLVLVDKYGCLFLDVRLPTKADTKTVCQFTTTLKNMLLFTELSEIKTTVKFIQCLKAR